MRLKKGEMALPQVLLAHGRCGFAPAYLLLHSNRIQGRDMCLGCSDRAIRSDDMMTGRHGNFDEVHKPSHFFCATMAGKRLFGNGPNSILGFVKKLEKCFRQSPPLWFSFVSSM